MRVLVVEDQVDLADDIADGLRDQGLAADVAYHGASGIEKALMNHYDVVVLDRDLPKVARYFQDLEKGLAEMEIPSRLHIMQSNGGLVPSETARRHPVQTILSGPAAGALRSLPAKHSWKRRSLAYPARWTVKWRRPGCLKI